MESVDEPIITVLDVETTGLSAFFDRICEVGLVRARGDTVLETYQSLVNPQCPISPGAARVNGLSDDQVCDAPVFAEIADQVLSRLEGSVLVCHNAPFDLAFLDAEMSRIGRSWQPVGVIDTLQLAREYFNFNSNRLSAIARDLRIENSAAHRALGDALTTFQVFRTFYRELAGDHNRQVLELVRSYRLSVSEIDLSSIPPILQEALTQNAAVEITYLDAQGRQTCRAVTPRQLLSIRGEAYLVAFCHLRQAERHFRLDRILKIN